MSRARAGALRALARRRASVRKSGRIRDCTWWPRRGTRHDEARTGCRARATNLWGTPRAPR
eukprot:7377257-Prymnesium_polylepis.2